MNISPSDQNLFCQFPNQYVLRVGKDNRISAERKGLWTWIKAHTFWRNEYKLTNIVKIININVSNYKRSFITTLNIKIAKQNKSMIIILPPKIKDPSVKKSIHDAVLDHLLPYLEGKITQETEDINRQPLPQKILEKLQKKFPEKRFDKDAVYNAVLKEYIKIAAWKGSLASSYVVDFKTIFHSTDYIVNQLIEPLQHAVAIDFRGHKIPENIKDLLAKAINKYKLLFSPASN